MNKALPICLCVFLMLVGVIFFGSNVKAQGGGIIVEGADYVTTTNNEYSAELINMTKEVTSRVIVEYSDFNSKLNLNKSDGLNEAARTVTPRVIVESSDFNSKLNLNRSAGLNEAASIVTSRVMVEYSDFVSKYELKGNATLLQLATNVMPRIIVEYADYVFSADMEHPFGVTFSGDEKSFTESTLTESLLVESAVLNNVSASGDLNGTLNFTSFETISISTGSFAGKGFSKGEWEATLEGLSYIGDWRGALFLKPSERRIYLKGSVSGEIFGTVEGYLTESISGSGTYDKYQATWKIGRLGDKTISATITLNGSLSYLSALEFPATRLYFLQTSIEGTISGFYNGSLSTVINHLRIVNGTPYEGEGYSTISYTSNFGTGEGWTYDRLTSPTTLTLKGLFTHPLYGVISAILDETTMPRTLHIRIDRVDLGLPPMADVEVQISGPGRVSPGQTITYMVDLRNDGLKNAENVTMVIKLPYNVTYKSNIGGGVYDGRSHEVFWRLGNIPAKTWMHIAVVGTVKWGLLSGTILEPIVSVPMKEIEVRVDPTVSTVDEVLEATENLVRMNSHMANQSVSGTLEIEVFSTTVAEEIEPAFQSIEDGDEVTITFEYTASGSPLKKFWGFIKGLKTAFQIRDTVEDAQDIRRYVIETQDLLDFAFQKGMLTPEKYADFSELASNIAHVELIIPHGIRQFPIFGEVYYKSTKGIFGWITAWFFPKHLEKAIQIDTLDPDFRLEDLYKLYFEENSYDSSSTESTVAVARDPNIKCGPEGHVSAGQTLNYTVEYENEGEGIAFGVYFTDVLDEDLDDSTLEIGPVICTMNGSVIAGPGTYNPSTRTITWLVGEVGPGEGGYANYSVKVRNNSPIGTEIINFATVYFPSVPETTQTNAIVSVVGWTNIAIMDVLPSKLVIGTGSVIYVNVTVTDQGHFSEAFNLTLYADTTVIETKNVFLLPRSSDYTIFLLNTTGFAYGNYTIWAYAEPVSGETNTADNTYTHGTVVVTILGDVNGDRKVDAADLVDLNKAYGSTLGSPTWNANCDINGDNKVNVLDLFIHGKNYGKPFP